MVFANLREEDKEAFFALLDEYFTSRSELAEALKLGSPARALINSGSQVPNLNVAAAHRTFAANPQATSAAVSSGLRSMSKSSPRASVASNPDVADAVGRFAAASLAFNGGNAPKPPGPKLASAPKPPPPPRRTVSSSSQDQSSAKSILWNTHKKESPPPPAPAALPSPKGMLTPLRRNTATRPRPPTPEPEPEPEYEGEWAEALYDYKSADRNDLPLQAEDRVLVTARTSDDWWTGEVGGKSGLFPASYVKLL